MRYYLLTHHGRFLCRARDGRGLRQAGWNEIVDRDELAAIDVDPACVGHDFAALLADTPMPPREAHVRHLGPRTIELDVTDRTICLKRNGEYLSAENTGDIREDSLEAYGWERLVAVSDADMDVLATVFANAWIVQSSGELIGKSGIALEAGHALRVGPIKVALAFSLPFDLIEAPLRITLLNEGWRLEEIIQFRPLIYYTVFGNDQYFAQLHVSLESLMHIGRYDGDLMVLTDRTKTEICNAVPSLQPDRVHVAPFATGDRTSVYAARYSIIDAPGADRFQPLVYVDGDVVWNTRVTPMLVDIAMLNRITAPIETFSLLAESRSVGATLLQKDYAQPGLACGFNSGTLGIPNLTAHRQALALIQRVIANYLAIHGRNALSWGDQEVANYVSYRRAQFDLVTMSKYVRYGDASAARVLGDLTGLVHFWATGRDERAEIMRQYLSVLLDHAAHQLVPPERPIG
jgi:hypothetical protein